MAIFLPYYLGAFALLFLELLGAPLRAPATPRWPAWVWIAFCVALYALHLAAMWFAASYVGTPIHWPSPAPIGVASADVRAPDLFEAGLLALGAAQSYALLGLYRARAAGAPVAAGFVAMMLLSLASPAFESPDAYAYAGDAILGLHAYAPPHDDFTGQYETINRYFMSPMLPAPYGPLWIALVQIVTAPAHALLGKLLLLRAFGALCFVGLLAALRAFGVAPRAIAIAALNPALAAQFVCDAHNDLLGLTLLVAAAALLRRGSSVAGAATVAVAALIKLPFAAIGVPVFAEVRNRPLRYACAAAAVSLAAALSWFGGGAAYFRALAVHVPAAGAAYAFNLAIALAAVAILAIAFLGGRRLQTGVWPIAMMSAYVAAWYVPYGIAYALAKRRILAYMLLALPLACALLDAKFMRWWTSLLVLPLVVVLSVLPNLPKREGLVN